MKKVISVLLAVFLLLSLAMTAVVAVAAEDEEKTKILYEIPNELATNQNSGSNEGWRNSKVDAGKPGLQALELDGKTGLGFAFSGTEANYFNTIRFLYYTATPLDLTEIKYVEFDLYISNASMYSPSTNSIMVELCSSGRQDANEISTDVRPDLVDGWNHIKIKMENFKSGSPETFVQTAWNFFRLCVNGPYNTGSDELTLAIANLTFWNGLNEDGLDEEEAKLQEMMAKIQPTLDKINELADIKSKDNLNEENHESVKATIAEAYELYNALGEEEQAVVSDEGGLRILKTAERAVKAYEDYLAELEAQKPDCTEHVDEENDGKCDVCGADVPVSDPDDDNTQTPGNDDIQTPDDDEQTPGGDEQTPGGDDTQTPGENDSQTGGNDQTQEEPAKKGCKGMISVGALAMMILAGAWVTVSARKK